MNLFEKYLKQHRAYLVRKQPDTLQVNLGRLCNLACVHCHVEAGPTQTEENMDAKTALAVVKLMDRFSFSVLDLTGGAPEMNPHFKTLVQEACERKIRVIDRCNLTILQEPNYDWAPDFLKTYQVEVIASLPCYSKDNVDHQRGKGTFKKSIAALQLLNALGYGQADSGLFLHLVYNPVGPHLPPNQAQLEEDYKKRLKEDFQITFNRLFTITNMPITRYEKYLKAFNQYESYVALLKENFNPDSVKNLMCLDTISVGWDGQIYDCDFNQQLKMPLGNADPLTVFKLAEEDLSRFDIRTAEHCFGCTAGAGSSCQGVIV